MHGYYSFISNPHMDKIMCTNQASKNTPFQVPTNLNNMEWSAKKVILLTLVDLATNDETCRANSSEKYIDNTCTCNCYASGHVHLTGTLFMVLDRWAS